MIKQNKIKWRKRLLVSTPTEGWIRFEWAYARYGQIIPVNWEFVLLKPDRTEQKIKMKKLIPIQDRGKPLYEFMPADFKEIYFFMSEEKPGLYTMGKFPFTSNLTAYFSDGHLQFVQFSMEFGMFDSLSSDVPR